MILLSPLTKSLSAKAKCFLYLTEFIEGERPYQDISRNVLLSAVREFKWYTAVLARRKLSEGGSQANRTARDLGTASYIASFLGIVLVLLLLVRRH